MHTIYYKNFKIHELLLKISKHKCEIQQKILSQLEYFHIITQEIYKFIKIIVK